MEDYVIVTTGMFPDIRTTSETVLLEEKDFDKDGYKARVYCDGATELISSKGNKK